VPTPAPAEAVRLAGRSAETTNYEISHVTRHTVRPHGEISRLSVAVILDDALVTAKGKDGSAARQYKPREREELLKIQNIVSGAVGLDTGRGDLLTVENVAFEDRLSIEEGPAPGFWRQQWDRVGQPEVLEVGRVAGIVVFGLLAFLFVVRPMVKRALAIPLRMPEPIPAAAQALPGGSGGPAELPPTIEDLEGAIEAELAAAEVAQGSDKRRVPVLAKRLGGLTLKEPEAAARLVRAWLAEDRGGR
jgi:flagellar M-ring protein FliF